MNRERDYYVEPENAALKTSGVELLYTYHNHEGNLIFPHIHESIEFLYILDGEFRVYADKSKYELKPGDLIMFCSNTIHRTYSMSSGTTHYFVIKIKPSVLISLAGGNSGYAYIFRFILNNGNKIHWTREELENTPIPSYACALMKEHDSPSIGTEVIRKTMAASILISILRDDESQGRSQGTGDAGITAAHQIYKAIDYMNKNYSNEITVRECSRVVNMSYSYFSRMFQKITGKQFRRYLNEIRINHAEKLIMSTDRSITEIAMECGFNDVSYFISLYKSLRGVTPNTFRKHA